jgi:putative glutathione S-transferase
MLIDGKWVLAAQLAQKTDESGAFQRPVSSFRNWITRDGAAGPTGEGGFAVEPGRYHLYVAMVCPWACRTLAVRALKGLEEAISVSRVEAALTDYGWKFPDAAERPDPRLPQAGYMHEIYTAADPAFTGRVTVPVLWDKQRGTVVNNESADIIHMLNDAFADLVPDAPDLRPDAFRGEMDELNDRLLESFNNGVYRAGFAESQEAYEAAFEDVFATLDFLEERLADGRTYLFGDTLTETDIRAFVTLVRFDPAYFAVFKCNRAMVADYAYLPAYVNRMLALPGIAETVNLDHIKRGYYGITWVNPTGIVATGPDTAWIAA